MHGPVSHPQTTRWWQLSSNSLWKQRLRQSIETLRHLGCQRPREYAINDEPVAASTAVAKPKGHDWPLSPLEDGSVASSEADVESNIIVRRH